MKEAAKNAVQVVAAAPAKGAPAKETKKVEEKPKEEEADVGMGGLFGDEYWSFYPSLLSLFARLCFVLINCKNRYALFSPYY